MKRICMIVPSFTAKGGIASVVSGYRNSELEKQYNIRYIETYTDKNKVCKVLKAISAYLKFLLYLIFWKPDLVHIHSSFNGSFYRKLPFIYLSSWWHKPVVNHVHGSAVDELYVNAGEKKKRLVENVFNKCDKLIVLSDEWKQVFEQFINSNKIVVIENYSILHDENRNKKDSRQIKILFLGFLSKAKGCYDIPLIVKNVVEEFSNVEFILAGDGNPVEVSHIKSLIELNHLQKYISLPGWIRDEKKEKALSEADIFMLPSYGEAMPMSILEAMGYGLPVISSNVGGIPQLIQQNVNGMMCDPGDIEGFTGALKTLLKDKDLMKTMGNNSLKIIEQRYSLDLHIQKISDLYEHLLDISSRNN